MEGHSRKAALPLAALVPCKSCLLFASEEERTSPYSERFLGEEATKPVLSNFTCPLQGRRGRRGAFEAVHLFRQMASILWLYLA